MSSTVITTTPGRKRKPSSARRLFTRKRARVARTTTSPLVVRLGRGPCPPKSVVTLKYNQNYASPGVIFDKMFNLNSIFSPEAAGGAHQPLGHDQWAVFYGRYRVRKVKMTLIVGSPTSISSALKIVVLADNVNSTYSTVELATEQIGSTVHVGNMSGPDGPIRITRTFYPNKVNGASAKEYNSDDRFAALMTANPTEKIMLHVLGSDIVGNAAAAGAVQYSILLEYTVEMFDAIPLAQS